MWIVYNYYALLHCKDYADDVLFIEHNEYFTNTTKQLNSLAKFLKTNDDLCAKDVINSNLYHNKTTSSSPSNSIVGSIAYQLYETLKKLSFGSLQLNQLDWSSLHNTVKNIEQSSFDPLGLDCAKKAFGDGITYKKYCIDITASFVKKKKNNLMKYFKQKNIHSLYIYGIGSCASPFFSFFAEAGITILGLFDKSSKTLVPIENQTFFSKTLTSAHPNEWIINTVPYYIDVKNHISNYFDSDKIISLYELIIELCQVQ